MSEHLPSVLCSTCLLSFLLLQSWGSALSVSSEWSEIPPFCWTFSMLHSQATAHYHWQHYSVSFLHYNVSDALSKAWIQLWQRGQKCPYHSWHAHLFLLVSHTALLLCSHSNRIFESHWGVHSATKVLQAFPETKISSWVIQSPLKMYFEQNKVCGNTHNNKNAFWWTTPKVWWSVHQHPETSVKPMEVKEKIDPTFLHAESFVLSSF